MKIEKIYLDMDGCIADFVNQYIKFYGEDLTHKHIPDEELYTNTKNAKVFWEKMPWMKDGKKLYSYLRNLCIKKDIELWILSAPAKPLELDPTSYSGKVKWLSNNLPEIFTKNMFILDNNKGKYANEHSILIDDHQSNLNDCKNNDGIPVLHIDTENTIKKIEDIIK